MPLKVTKEMDSAINLTPLIDIVFLLIIFFMVGTRFSELNEQEKHIPLQVPAVSDSVALTSPPKKRIINVLTDGSLLLESDPVSLEALEAELANAHDQYRGLGVVIRGDSNARHKSVTDVMALCRKLGIQSINIAVRVANETSQTNGLR